MIVDILAVLKLFNSLNKNTNSFDKKKDHFKNYIKRAFHREQNVAFEVDKSITKIMEI